MTDTPISRDQTPAMITSITLRLLRLPLKVPYKLAFGPIAHFDTLLVEVRATCGSGSGEATVLPGYTSETVEGSWKRANALASSLLGTSVDAGKTAIANNMRDAPFTAAALTTALEMAEGHDLLHLDDSASVPILAGINATDEQGIAKEIEDAISAGYLTLKIKAGFDCKSDLERVKFIQNVNEGRARLRIDANQGYDRREGCDFAARLAPDSIELLEQPCPAGDWAALEEVAKVSAVPLMLDESIYSEHDIERAAQIGADFVKLKLMKFISLDRLAAGLRLIRHLGMEPVLGNGVASPVSCWMEACVARTTIRNAGEMNGFLRPTLSILEKPLQVHSGNIVLPKGKPPELDEEAIRQVTQKTAQFGDSAAHAEAVK